MQNCFPKYSMSIFNIDLESTPSITMNFRYINIIFIPVAMEIPHFHIFYEFSKRFLAMGFSVLTHLGASIMSVMLLLYSMAFSLKTPLYAFSVSGCGSDSTGEVTFCDLKGETEKRNQR